MSTKAIREALEMLDGVLEHPNTPAGFDGVVKRAKAEVEAIEKAAKAIMTPGLHDEGAKLDAYRLLNAIRKSSTP